MPDRATEKDRDPPEITEAPAKSSPATGDVEGVGTSLDGSQTEQPPREPAFDKLLRYLDADPAVALARLENLYERARVFALRRRSPYAEDIAQESLVRLAEAVDKGRKIESIDAFFMGIVRNVWLESLRDGVPPPGAPDAPARPPGIDPTDLITFNRCLDSLKPDERELIESYHNAADKEALAKQLGIADSTLRVRVYRVTEQLRRCYRRTFRHRRETKRPVNALQESRECIGPKKTKG